jgi:diacylglycerol O-acyltransferase / wax synthase
MPDARECNQLSSGDALFLYLEREGMPLNVASVSVFEGVISARACRRFIESKLPLIPRYRQRVMPPPFGIGLPTWEYDPDFSIRRHVREVRLHLGTESELKNVAGSILSKTLDRRRPLWDFTLLQGLRGNRTAVITRMHHCLADGLAGVGLMNLLMDASPEVPALPKRSPEFQVPASRKSRAFIDELITSSLSMARRILNVQMEMFNIVHHVMTAASRGIGKPASRGTSSGVSEPSTPAIEEFAKLMPEITAATENLPFNVICRGPQKFRWAEIQLSDLKAIKNACGVKVNDVALTVVASAIRRYAELHHAELEGRLLRIVVPVNIRDSANAHDLGNHITFLPITIPFDIRKPRQLLAAVHERTAFLKYAHLGECIGLAGTMLGTVPTIAQEVAGPIVSQVRLGLCNLIFTNVPGPQEPLYLLGHKLLRCYPYVPIGGELGINCAVLTYNGTAYFGFTGDVHAAPDLARLEGLLMESFTELQAAVGLRPRKHQRARARARGMSVVQRKVASSEKSAPPVPKPVQTDPAAPLAATTQKTPLAQVVA